MIETVRIAFYHAHKGNCYDRIVGLFDDYSHVEIQVRGLCWSSSPRDGGFRSKEIDLNSGKWDILSIFEPVDFDAFLLELDKFRGKKYDYTVIANYLGVRRDLCKKRVWCGEVVTSLFNALYHTNVPTNVTLKRMKENIWNTKKFTTSIISY